MGVRPDRVCCLASLKWLPVVFVVGVLLWSYYAYVVQLCLRMFNVFVDTSLIGVASYFSVDRQAEQER
jgi:hypothetical protein